MAEVAGMTGREILQAIIDGKLPQAPISETMSFWITEVGDDFAAFEGQPGVIKVGFGGALCYVPQELTYCPVRVKRRHTRHVNCASALPPKADIPRRHLDVCFGPEAAVVEC